MRETVNTKQSHISVLVVDDSAFMRVAIKKMLEEDSRIEVVGVARNGEEGIEKIRRLKPDLVTMDIEMPVMDGLTALEKIMEEMPLPVIMISALTEEGADETFKALDLGAVDFIPKGGKSYVNLNITKIAEQLRLKAKAIVQRNRLKRITGITKKTVLPDSKVEPDEIKIRKRCDLVTIGISTGGPFALGKMLPRLPESFKSSILVVQHMPPAFTAAFAQRLDSISSISVKEA